MTTPIYIRARNPDNGKRVVEELLTLGIPRERLELFGRRIPAGLSVRATQWGSDKATLVPAVLVGAVGLPLLAALLLAGIDPVAGLVLALLGGGAGALWAGSRRQRAPAQLGLQPEALKPDDLIIVADLEQSDLQRVETQIAEHHPEVMVLGPDPQGSPPFP